MKDKNFTFAFQVLAIDQNDGWDYNYRIPPEIGRWTATMITVGFDGENFTNERVNVPFLT